ncbi:AAA domain-containing protein [Amylostereum chailletii]|nr:AAA domain-containing protein [Amylostereum chailletii]
MISDFLNNCEPEQANSLENPPSWITEFREKLEKDEEEYGKWTKVGSGGREQEKDDADLEAGIYGFWKQCRDVEFLSAPPAQPLAVSIPNPGSSNVWSMSPTERHRLAAYWEADLRSMAYKSNAFEFKILESRYQRACANYKNVKDETRRRILSNANLIGCTTTGAASLVSLLKTVGPKVLMVEEAGQVLESHIIAALVPSVEHFISIGDPKQLHPTLANYSLSMDSQHGRKFYKFDRSLMERLADSGWPMSQINVQRRMRPSISHFPRTILYPKLEDHPIVKSYPPVQGMEKDVYFFTHTHPEDSEQQDSVSKSNKFEVDMIKDLVLYFLKQGVYNGTGDIAVLCAYLGQVQKVREALRDLMAAVSVDERDEYELFKQGERVDDIFDQVFVGRRIRLGTVDTFQGNEAKIVIISLVRNSGQFEEGHGSIGFLKSSNRINVALSRAKHGMFILGNASNLRQNPTWKTILDDMEAHDQIGDRFSIVCHRHPNRKIVITEPGQLNTESPEGGCLLPCDDYLPCGHTCPSVCHPDEDLHDRLECYRPCTRNKCPRGHPCPLLCYKYCGQCMSPIYDVTLPCGHIAKTISWYNTLRNMLALLTVNFSHELDNLRLVECTEIVEKRLLHCEHTAMMACFEDPGKASCEAICDSAMTCCSRSCNAKCFQCQKLSIPPDAPVPAGIIPRVRHESHPCDRILKCQHVCGLDCSPNHNCNGQCGQPCRQQCSPRGYHACPKACWETCSPCTEPCLWTCPHIACPVPCGSVCSRLPCDELCTNTLACGHPCPSVCGEPCPQQACPVCLPADRQADVIDLILGKTLAEFDPSTGDIRERLITLQCGHLFTVETLDDHCGMSAHYEIGPKGEFLDVKAPPITHRMPPCCPTCQGPITALRYGRVIKRANLDILEQNAASTISTLNV